MGALLLTWRTLGSLFVPGLAARFTHFAMLWLAGVALTR